MGSKAHKNRSAAVSLHHYKAEQRSRIIIYRGKAITFECDSIVDNCFQLNCILLLTVLAHCSYQYLVTTKEGMTMPFDLSQYIPFNAFAMIWIACMLAGLSYACRNDKEGK